MLRLILAILFLILLIRFVFPQFRLFKIIKREHHARYNRKEWEKIKRELENK